MAALVAWLLAAAAARLVAARVLGEHTIIAFSACGTPMRMNFEVHPHIQQAVSWSEARCVRVWNLPPETLAVDVSVNERLRCSLARVRLRDRTIDLRSDVATAPARVLREVLCHELAHLAVFRLHGSRARPHGPEWRALMVAAGYAPVATHCRVVLGSERRQLRRSSIYEHRCPVCQMVRIARRRVPAWRCTACVAAGLPGELVVTRRKDGANR